MCMHMCRCCLSLFIFIHRCRIRLMMRKKHRSDIYIYKERRASIPRVPRFEKSLKKDANRPYDGVFNTCFNLNLIHIRFQVLYYYFDIPELYFHQPHRNTRERESTNTHQRQQKRNAFFKKGKVKNNNERRSRSSI